MTKNHAGMARIPATPENIERAAAAIRAGDLVAFPTETVYGLGANAFDPQAVAKIFEAKRRPTFDPLIVHVLDLDGLAQVVAEIPPPARKLAQAFWPGPLTIVLERSERIPGIVTSGLPTVAVRIPAHAVARDLLACAGVPIAAPSANPFGFLSPTRAIHVERWIGDAAAIILDAGRTEHGVESTIVQIVPELAILRYGAIEAERIEDVLGPIARRIESSSHPVAPGQLPMHYAPRTPLRIVHGADVPWEERSGAAYVAFANDAHGYATTRVLSRSGDLREAAGRLFDVLHELDALGLARIDVEPVPEHGLGLAIMDRLRRASYAG